jgi:hypothetical protein
MVSILGSLVKKLSGIPVKEKRSSGNGDRCFTSKNVSKLALSQQLLFTE